MHISQGESHNLSLVLYPELNSLGEGRNLHFTLWLANDLERFRSKISERLLKEFDHRDLREIPRLSALKEIGLVEIVYSMAESIEPEFKQKGAIAIGLKDTLNEVLLELNSATVTLLEKVSCDLSTVTIAGAPIVRTLTLSTEQKLPSAVSQKAKMLSFQKSIVNAVSPEWWSSDDIDGNDAVALKRMLKLASENVKFNGPLTICLTHKLSRSSWSATSS
jgi:hypothetical protein